MYGYGYSYGYRYGYGFINGVRAAAEGTKEHSLTKNSVQNGRRIFGPLFKFKSFMIE